MADSQAKTIDIKTAESLYKQIQAMEVILEDLRGKVVRLLPAKYGSDLWWEKSDVKAARKIAKGGGLRFKNAAEVLKYLES